MSNALEVSGEERRLRIADIANMEGVLVKAQVSKTWAWIFLPKGWVYDAKLIVFAFNSMQEFVVLQNTFHWEWSIQYGTTLRLDMSYTPTTNFETFPFPTSTSNLNDIGDRYYTHRQNIMLTRQEGLTKTYNRFHNPDETAVDIQTLRELHIEMDYAVAAAYGWQDLDLAKLEKAILNDLLGPLGGEEEELDEDNVSDRYLVGLLAPQQRRINLEQEDELAVAGIGTAEEGSTEVSVPPKETMFP